MTCLKKMRENKKKGFTLVELIVVIVILAILAAALVPALLGYIDEAKKSKYYEEAHSILTAVQVYEDEMYAKGSAAETSIANMKTRVDNICNPTTVDSGTVAFKGTTGKPAYTVESVSTLTFTSQDGKAIVMNYDSTGWTLVSVGGVAQ